jgi:hypothetical protein
LAKAKVVFSKRLKTGMEVGGKKQDEWISDFGLPGVNWQRQR